MAARPTRPATDCGCDTPRIEPRLTPVLSITGDGEADRLWKHAMVGTSTCIGLVEQYAALGMPHLPANQIAAFRNRLDQVLTCLDQLPVDTQLDGNGGPADPSVEPLEGEPPNESATESNEP